MKRYDLYLFVSEGDVIRGWHTFEAESDEAAIKVAEELTQQAPLELWQEASLVKRWEPRQ